MLRNINNIFIPTEEELMSLSKIVNNKEIMYDFIIAKLFEINLWSLYQNNNINSVPFYMMEDLIFENDKLIINDLKKAIIRMYSQLLLSNPNYFNNDIEIKIALNEISKTNKLSVTKLSNVPVPDLVLKETLEYILNTIRMNLLSSSRYRFEYRSYGAEDRRKPDGIIDDIFGGKLDVSYIDTVEKLQYLLCVDPLYITRIDDDKYKDIYQDSDIVLYDVLSFKGLDAKGAITRFLRRYKLDDKLWSNNHSGEISEEKINSISKILIRQR